MYNHITVKDVTDCKSVHWPIHCVCNYIFELLGLKHHKVHFSAEQELLADVLHCDFECIQDFFKFIIA